MRHLVGGIGQTQAGVLSLLASWSTKHGSSRCRMGRMVYRRLFAVQVMIGLINGALGRIWLLFYTRQFGEISTEYKPVALLSGYPFWTFLFFIISGVLTIETEKKRSPNLLKYAIRMNMNSFLLAVLGLILIRFEITLFLFKRGTIFWQETTAVNLSVYLWIFSIMELIIARKVVKQGN